MEQANAQGGPLHNGIYYCGIVPYLGIFQSDFTFLDEGSQTFLSPGAHPPAVLAPLPRRSPALIHQGLST